MTTKKHIVDKNRLKPGRIPLPHSLNATPADSVAGGPSICLIVADPQRAVKDVLQDDSFPAALKAQITTVIGFSKLKERYKSFESRRKLLAEHNVFLADDRIVTRLVSTLGKAFYKSGVKRPLPINIAAIEKVDGKRVKKDQRKKNDDSPSSAVASPTVVAKEIERALGCAFVHLAPSTTTAVRVGKGSFKPEDLAKNVETVVSTLVEKYVPQKWRNVKSIHVKGTSTMALPIWLADELWTDEKDVLEDEPEELIKPETESKKRKSADEKEAAPAKSSKGKKSKSEDDTDAAARKAKLLTQKAAALEDGDDAAALAAVKAAKKEKSKKTGEEGVKLKRRKKGGISAA